MRSVALLLLLAFGLISQVPAVANDNTAYQSANPSITPTDSALYELLSRVEQLQSEVQQLRGVVEEQAQNIADLERKQRNMYSDLDSRVQGLAPSPAPATANVQPATVAVPAVAVANTQSTAPATSVAPSTTANSNPVAVPTPIVAPSAAVATPTPAKPSEKERFQLAYETLRTGHNDQAIKMFDALITDNPSGELADTSLYWLGEAYKINREFDRARNSFNKLISLYPNSARIPDALFKMGEIEYDSRNYAKARDYFTQVNNIYPGSTAAHLASKKLALISQ